MPGQALVPDGAGRPVLLAVFGHPDDESINLGGTLALYAARGARTVVVTCTDGGAGEDHTGDSAGAGLGSVRRRELAQALRVLGVIRSEVLGYGDSGWPATGAAGTFVAAGVDAAASRLAVLIRTERPSVIVTHDADGGYGHPDHVQAHRVTLAAVEIAAETSRLDDGSLPWRVPRVACVVYPASLVQRYVAGLRAAGIQGAATSLAGLDEPDVADARPFGTPDRLVDVALDVSAYVEVKRAALARHRTQMPATHPLMRLPDDLRRVVWAKEYFRWLVGSAQTESAAPLQAANLELFDDLADARDT